jgi:hypothetical protein
MSFLRRRELGRAQRRLHRREIVNIHTHRDLVGTVGAEVVDHVRPHEANRALTHQLTGRRACR